MLIEIIFLISLKMQFEKSPYKYDTLNKLENIGLVSLTYLNFVGLYSVIVKNNPLDIAIIIISFLSFVGFFITWIILFTRVNVKQHIPKLFGFILEKLVKNKKPKPNNTLV